MTFNVSQILISVTFLWPHEQQTWVLNPNPEAKLQFAEFYTFTSWFCSAVCRSGGPEGSDQLYWLVFYTSCGCLSFHLPPRYSLIGEKRSTCQTFQSVTGPWTFTYLGGRQVLSTEVKVHKLLSRVSVGSDWSKPHLIQAKFSAMSQRVKKQEEEAEEVPGCLLFICHVFFLLQHEVRHASIRTHTQQQHVDY